MMKTYKIGEAAALLNLKTHVLRFWESEFSQIVPLRTEKGQRIYTEVHINLLRRIRHLLHEQGLTIEGAKRILINEAAKGITYTEPDTIGFDAFCDEETEDEVDDNDTSGQGSLFDTTYALAQIAKSRQKQLNLPTDLSAEEHHFLLQEVLQELEDIASLLQTPRGQGEL